MLRLRQRKGRRTSDKGGMAVPLEGGYDCACEARRFPRGMEWAGRDAPATREV